MIKLDDWTRQERADWNNKYGEEERPRLSIQIIPCYITNRVNFLNSLGHSVLGFKVERKTNNKDILTLVTNRGSDQYTGTFIVNNYSETLTQLGYKEI